MFETLKTESCYIINDVTVQFAKTYQPVVIEVDMADVPFYKKTPKELKLLKPQFMKHMVQRLLKSIKKTERILIIGKATSPWLTASKKLVSIMYIFCIFITIITL